MFNEKEEIHVYIFLSSGAKLVTAHDIFVTDFNTSH